MPLSSIWRGRKSNWLKEVELVVHADVPRMRQAHGELPEGFLDEHRCHAADTELDEEDLCILV